MAFFAATWWIWLIVSVVCIPVFFGSIFAINMRKAGTGMLLFIGAMLLFIISSTFATIGIVAAFISYAKG